MGVGLAVVGGVAAAGRLSPVLWSSDAFDRLDGERVRVLRVIDGDTLDVLAADGGRRYTRVRLWGIDAPEVERTVGGVTREAEPYAEAAKRWLADRVEGGSVVLELERHRVRDGFGRVLAHVYAAEPGGARRGGVESASGGVVRGVANGASLNAALLAAGLAEADGRWSHGELSAYAEAEAAARSAGVGVWGE